MWLASISRRLGKSNDPHPAESYSARERQQAEILLHRVLDGVGDERWGRHFRMCLTQCLHRGLSDAELERLSTGACTVGRGIAGAPLEVFWQRGVPDDCQSAKPCHAPGRDYLTPTIYLPRDCGTCVPCRARSDITSRLRPAKEPIHP